MRILVLPEILENPYVVRKEKSALEAPESIKDLPEKDRAEIEGLYASINTYVDLIQTCEEVFCNILMTRKNTGKDIVLSGRVVEKVIKMGEDRTIKLEELEWTFLKETFFPEDHGKKDEEKVFQGFGLTAKMYPLLEAIENAPKDKEEEDKPKLELKKPSNEQPVEEEVETP